MARRSTRFESVTYQPAFFHFVRFSIVLIATTTGLLLSNGPAQASGKNQAQVRDTGAVSITEFVASYNEARNSTTLLDEDGEPNDWIEIHNAGASAVDLSGWRLTDRLSDRNRWFFSEGTAIDGGAYLIVFASGKNRRDPTGVLHTNFSLKREGESLALIDAAGSIVSDLGLPYPTQYTGVSYGYAENEESATGYSELAHYMFQPTPGQPNGSALGPVIYDVGHEEADVSSPQDIRVSAAVADENPITNVTLHYRFGYDEERHIPMQRADQTNYSAAIPTGGLPQGTLVRYYITASAQQGSDGPRESRWPVACRRPTQLDAPSRAADQRMLPASIWLPIIATPPSDPASDPNYVRCPDYMGTVIDAASIDGGSDVPVMHWYVEHDPIYGWEWYRERFNEFVEAGNPSYLYQDEGTLASLYYAGRFYDNIFIKLGGSGSLAYRKKEMEFEFDRDYELHLRGNESSDLDPSSLDYDIINLTTTAADESYIRQPLSWHAYAAAGVPASHSFPVRLQENGTFFSVAIFVEQPDVNYLRRYELSDQGSFFKSYYNSLTSEHFDSALNMTDNLRQIRPRTVNRMPALREFIQGINTGSTDADVDASEIDRDAIHAYLMDNVDIPNIINYMAVRTVLDDYDTIWHNFYLHQSVDFDEAYDDEEASSATHEWRFVPWDKDKTLVPRSGEPSIAEHPFFGIEGYSDRYNALMDAIINDPVLRSMYLRRLVSVRDLMLGPDGGPQTLLGQKASELLDVVAGAAELDTARWTVETSQEWEVSTAAFDPTRLQDLIARRWRVLSKPAPNGFGDLLPDSSSVIDIHFGETITSTEPSSSAVVLVNCAAEAVDISRWQLHGNDDKIYTLQSGVVIPGNGGRLYVTPDVIAFRDAQRLASGEDYIGIFVQGGFGERLFGSESDDGYIWAILTLQDDGTLIATSESVISACPAGS